MTRGYAGFMARSSAGSSAENGASRGPSADADSGRDAARPTVPAWWVAPAWGVALPSTLCLIGAWIAGVNKEAAGWFLLLWPIATIGGMAMGCMALMQRLARSRMANMPMFLLTAMFGVLCLAVQGAMALWLGGVVRGK